jgi:fused signal recognition particle receptor
VVNKNWQNALSRTKRVAFGRLSNLLGTSELTPEFWDELEAALIQADLGVKIALELLDEVKAKANQEGHTSGDQIHSELRSSLLKKLISPPREQENADPLVIVMVGVNGSGKTTTAARLANYYKKLGKSCILAAADTYRAAASEQLSLWANRLDFEIVQGVHGSDPGAVVYDATQAAIAQKADILIIDTSGRMHTHHNLMAELQKVCRVPKKLIPEAPHQILLVLDATTGQNGISQARAFLESVDVTGVVLAKLDTSSKGGVGFNVATELNLPIVFVGTGETAEDLVEFNPAAYVDELLSPSKSIAQSAN